MAPDWRKAAFIHMEKKNAALKELDILREEHVHLKQKHAQLQFDAWVSALVIWLWGMVCVFYALKINS